MTYKKILVTLDGSSFSETILPHVQAIGRQFSAEVILLQVVAESDVTSGGFHAGESHEKAKRYLKEKRPSLPGMASRSARWSKRAAPPRPF